MKPAARVTDSIKHEDWADTHYAPAALGGGIAVTVIIIASGGTAAVALAVGGGIVAIGKLIDKFVMTPTSHKIISGADTVRTNLLASALAHPKCKLDTDGKVVFTGADHCYIEESNASRVDDLTTCPGKIVTGSDKPFQLVIGGPTVTNDRPGWYTTFMAVDLAYSAVGLANALRSAATAYDKVLAGYDALGLAGTANELFTGEKLLDSTIKDAFDGGRGVKDAIDAIRGR